jgi:hypothetical protein
MTLSEHISNYLRDAQYRIAELSIEMNELEDQGSYQYQKLYRSRLELALLMDILYEGKWLIQKKKFTITAVSKANPGVVTLSSSEGLAIGDVIEIKNVRGMTQLNGNKYTVKNISGNTFELYNQTGTAPVDSSAYSTYTSGGDVIVSWYNHLQVGTTSTWTETDVVSEIQYLRYHHNIDEAPGLTFSGHYLKIASTISGGGTGSGTGLPAGQYGQFIWYNSSDIAEAIDISEWGGQLPSETITQFFSNRSLL